MPSPAMTMEENGAAVVEAGMVPSSVVRCRGGGAFQDAAVEGVVDVEVAGAVVDGGGGIDAPSGAMPVSEVVATAVAGETTICGPRPVPRRGTWLVTLPLPSLTKSSPRRSPRTLGAKVMVILQVAGPAMVPTQVWLETAKSLLRAPSVMGVMEPTVTTSPAGTEKTSVVGLEVLPTAMPPKSTGPPGESDCAEAEASPAKCKQEKQPRKAKACGCVDLCPQPASRPGTPLWRERAPLGVCIPILHPAAREPVLRDATVGRGVAPEELASERALPKKLSGKLAAPRMMRCFVGPVGEEVCPRWPI